MKKYLLLAFAGLLLLTSVTGTARAQRLMFTIKGDIRWKKEMGIIPIGRGYKQASPVPCGQFFVAALDSNTSKAVAYTQTPLIYEGNVPGYHVCHYSLKAPDNTRLYMVAGLGGVLLLPKTSTDPLFISDPWIGGRESTPPSGAERGFTGQTHV